ncbi:FAD-dependent oxidoreductase [Alphaproteobacteria bacterium]|nr:FAD-dependent oxidoreductase [Alphaproteobacteria bacterium]
MFVNKYDWIVIGGGITGVTTAEILSRDGKKVMLVEKIKCLVQLTIYLSITVLFLNLI